MTSPTHPARFAGDTAMTATAALGQRAHRSLIDHTERLGTELVTVAPGVWCLVGNGLSNQTFVEGPEGLIAIDTGESVEEMAAALAALRTRTATPVVAVIYTHFHYVGGTTALAAAPWPSGPRRPTSATGASPVRWSRRAGSTSGGSGRIASPQPR